MQIEEMVNRVLGLGLDVGTKDAVKSALHFIGYDTKALDSIYIEVRNRLNLKAFTKVPYRNRALFMSHCLKSSEKCKAKITDAGLQCEDCGACQLTMMKKEALALGYKVYIVPGGSLVFKIIKKAKPEACVGVACMFELEEAFEKLTMANIPYQGIPLSKDGCVDTNVDVHKVIEVLRIIDKQSLDKSLV